MESNLLFDLFGAEGGDRVYRYWELGYGQNLAGWF